MKFTKMLFLGLLTMSSIAFGAEEGQPIRNLGELVRAYPGETALTTLVSGYLGYEAFKMYKGKYNNSKEFVALLEKVNKMKEFISRIESKHVGCGIAGLIVLYGLIKFIKYDNKKHQEWLATPEGQIHLEIRRREELQRALERSSSGNIWPIPNILLIFGLF